MSSDGAEPPEIAIHNPARYDAPAALAIWIGKVLPELAPEATGLGLLLTDDDAIQELNGRFRNRHSPTDVLSFPAAAAVAEGGDPAYLGDIAISVATAADQAAAHGHALEREIKILLLHGILHCLGWDHETDGGEMLALEEELIARWIDDG